ncbi:MAG: CotH kinase family protein, partial [Planctomycetales bacterium]|nr:CotH kinase family protein [Planctomycetales bacterium]
EPETPSSNQPVTITIKVTDDDGIRDVQLEYQIVEPGSYIRLTDDEYATNWTTIAMHDDGLAGDASAGDGVFSVTMPGDMQQHRRLIRYRITAADAIGNSIRGPYDDDPSPNFAYFVYDGVPDWTGADRPGVTEPVTYASDVMDSLPAYHLIADETDVTNSQYVQRFNNRRFKGTLYYDGVVYDHMEFKNRGQNSTYVTGKNKWKLFFNRGHEFQIRDDYGNKWSAPIRKLNLGTAASPWARPNRGLAGMDEALAFKFFNLAGVSAPNISAFQLRVVDDAVEADPDSQYNGDLWGLYLAFEDPGGRFLDEHGLPDGNLFRMQGGTGDLRHQGLGLPGNRSDLRDFISGRTGYAKRNPVQPVEWWRENVDLESYYSYRAVIEAVNHSDLRDKENSLQFYNSETGKWTQLPWDLDLLYEEFDRWGPDGVQNASILEQFRLSLEHDEINIEFQARLREMQDLLFNSDQAWQAVEEYARYVEPFAAIDRAMWDYNPRTSSIHRGYFYRSPAPYHGGANGLVRRELTSPDFEGMVNWVKEFIVDGGFGGDQLRVLHTDADIPATPTITALSPPEFPIANLSFQTSAFSDPQGAGSFQAMQWRIGEVTDPNAPSYDPSVPVHYEVTSVWESGSLDAFDDTITIDPSALQVGHAYRARVRMQDNTGRWSHWSEPVQFIPTPGSSDITNFLRISEVHYHPADPSADEIAAGFTNSDEFEFIELINIGSETIELAGASLAIVDNDGNEEGVSFTFADAITNTLGPGERTVVVENMDAFVFRYGNNRSIAGQWSGRLNNAGEMITLAAYGEPFLQFRYDDAWYPATDGDGSSLEFIDPTVPDLSAWTQRENWRASRQTGGTPGLPSSIPGDANHDGLFNSQDLVQIFQAAEYEDDVPGNSTWEEGDWDGDGDFTTSDLVFAF